MTSPHLLRSSGVLARSALVVLVLAGCAGAAASQAPTGAQAPSRTAVLAGADAPSAAVSAAARGAVVVRHADGSLDAQAQATRLAAEGFDTIIGVGAQARAAVTQAAAGEVGDGTRWRTAAR